MVALSDVTPTVDAAREKVQQALRSGAALERFRRNVEVQGGDPRICDDYARLLPLTPLEVKVESTRTGFITGVDTAEVGYAVASIGGGRIRIEDTIDYAVGFAAEARIGDRVKAGDSLGLLYCRDRASAEAALERIGAAYVIGDERASAPTLIKEVITA